MAFHRIGFDQNECFLYGHGSSGDGLELKRGSLAVCGVGGGFGVVEALRGLDFSFVRQEGLGEVVPVKPDKKGEKPDNDRGADKEQKFPEPAYFPFFLLSHFDRRFAVNDYSASLLFLPLTLPSPATGEG